jgi:hypothetical protein
VSPFAPDPPLRGGGPEVAKLFHELMTRAPNLKKIVKNVQVGPTGDVIDEFVRQELKGGTKIDPHEFMGTNLMGLADSKKGTISLNPIMNPVEMQKTLVHELAHLGAHRGRSEKVADHAGELFLRAKGLPNWSELDELLQTSRELSEDFRDERRPADIRNRK